MSLESFNPDEPNLEDLNNFGEDNTKKEEEGGNNSSDENKNEEEVDSAWSKKEEGDYED